MGLVEVGDGAVGGLELLDERAVVALADEVGGDEPRAPVHLRHLVREHVAVVVVASHAEAAARPADDLHGGGVADQVLELAACVLQQPGRRELLLVLRIEDLLHLLPEALLPLEDGLLRHHVGHDARLEAAGEEDMRQVLHVVERVVVDHHRVLRVLHFATVDDDGLLLDVLREECREHAPLADGLPPRAVLAPDGVALEEDGLVEAELDAGDVDRVTGDRDAVPTAPHGAVRRAPCPGEAHLLHLIRGRRDGGLLEDGADLGARGHSVVEHLVPGLVAVLATEVEVFPLHGVDPRLDPLLADETHRVPRHLLARDVGHRRGDDLLARGKSAGPLEVAPPAVASRAAQGAQHVAIARGGGRRPCCAGARARSPAAICGVLPWCCLGR
mmetsp:Transcript_68016/g.190489  ORF Transcript_68016/g.190489 Transcript_68016/m.190489 type:complete len:387 (+) Transcript_68016:705-1865(+)